MTTSTSLRQWLRRERWYFLPLVPFVLMAANFSYSLLFGERCWSPNRQYYLIQVESLLSSALYAPGTGFGWILVFDRSGRWLHHWHGNFLTYNRPKWKDDAILIGDSTRLPLPAAAGPNGVGKMCFCLYRATLPNACEPL
ncbi:MULTISPECIES: hypothetical protein [unclassified Cupriavidus]|uniref:hypothetical protein n=1 Tax=unclassified Cupriavidus TaxID=2640874 RepID=UPI001C001C71|nr:MULTISPECIES: hypothetical protein [unclassified Cupriavidus]MCA3187273.1 hypothetical protein [Cupriavidus sp.]MCA3193416.1 hypothetical protein [Cupriavidus sp.]MCA3198218.1 hypothetical protein [Cupriavidus sp.]MCA3204985.1 hypothetical protein [Cupriavidus sp.]MCA3208564.1 hypothetical protein [Cupriavidus sp.]